jgi:tetratricopeptide (TPR) repeat protein
LRALAVLLALGLLACAPLRGPMFGPRGAVRLSELADEGDAERRTSMRLVIQGLDAAAQGLPDQERAEYENALRVDPSNPYAYLALARHHVSGTSPERAFDFLDKTSALLEAQGAYSPRVEAHLAGLRGEALVATGRPSDAMPYLARARELDPWVWNDGHLAAEELR